MEQWIRGFPGGSDGKESACDAGDPGSVPGLGRSSGEGHGNPLQYSCLENSMDRGPWGATVHGVGKSVNQIIILKNSNQGLWKNYKEQGMYTTGGAWWATVQDITKASEKT